MYDKANPLFLMCEAPLHAGSGSGLGVVDLPIQREKHTDFPKIEGSSLKGSLREFFETKNKNNVEETIALFGSPTEAEEENAQAGSMGVADARLLLFPVKSMKGVFAWITCPRVLTRFKNDYALSGKTLDLAVPDGTATTPNSNILLTPSRVVLEEYAFDGVEKSDQLAKWGEWFSETLFGDRKDSYWAGKIKTDILILADDDFQDFARLSTEVITRTKINSQTGTVEQGALFTEEYLPADSILYSVIFTRGEYLTKGEGTQKSSGEKMEEEQLRSYFSQTLENHPVLQLGGNYTLGKGLLRTKFLNF